MPALALVEHGRNVTDEQIRACAATGGVVCVSGVSGFLGTRTPTADDVARHAAYVAQLVGVEHAGIGLDISFHQDGLDDTPPGNFDATYWWPKSAGYDRTLSRMTYTPVETWQVLASALQHSGMTGDEAEGATLAAVDSAVLAELPFLRIIHGMGTGVVRERVRRVLQRDRRVAKFDFAPRQQGGTGVTIAEFSP